MTPSAHAAPAVPSARAARVARALTCASLVLAGAALADESPLPKLGPDAVAITVRHDYLRTAPAPDYWAFSPFVKPQFTTSACSIAAVTATLDGLRGLPPGAEDEILSQQALLDAVDDDEWKALSAEGGDGVTFEQLEDFTARALAATGMDGWRADAFRPTLADEAALAALRDLLATNEASADDALMMYFNQGVLTGDWDGPHIALIGAYDAARDEVLVLEVDQQWYVPYWSPVPKALEAMTRPTSAEHGVLAGGTGGLLHVSRGG